MATAKKLPSGSWRCRVFSHYEIRPDGTKKSVYETFVVKDPSKRGKKECERLAAEWSVNRQDRGPDITVREAIRKYIDLKEHVLSPSTIRGYERYYANCYESIQLYSVRELTAPLVQSWVNAFSATHSPKYTKNAYGLLRSACEFCGGPQLHATMPASQRFNAHAPCDEEIRSLIEYLQTAPRARDAKEELLTAILLAAFGSLRRGEICALTAADFDFDDCTVRINKDIVEDKDRAPVLKHAPKTDVSNRIVKLPRFVLDRIDPNTRGRIIKATPEIITNRFRRAIRFSHAEIPFRFHDLRHYYVSIAHALGIPDAYIMQSGGWKTDGVMKRVYRNTLSDRAALEQQKLDSHFDRTFGESVS